jgi:hypothetical protein
MASAFSKLETKKRASGVFSSHRSDDSVCPVLAGALKDGI